jgi:hypothetical protein
MLIWRGLGSGQLTQLLRESREAATPCQPTPCQPLERPTDAAGTGDALLHEVRSDASRARTASLRHTDGH